MQRPNSFLKLVALGALFAAAVFLFTGASVTSVSSATSDAPVAEKELSPKDRLEVFEHVWKGVHDLYYDPEFHGVDWEEVGKRYRPQVEAAKSDLDFYSLLSRMTGELHDAHTRFSTPEQWENRQKQQGVSIGFFMTELDGKVVIAEVLPKSNAEQAGIEPGMFILSVDGKPIAERIEEVAQKTLESSTERITRLRVYGAVFSGPDGKVFKIGLQRPDGSTWETSVARQLLPRPPDVQSRLLPSGEAYIRFDGFQPQVTPEFKDALEKFHNAPGLIIDIRENGGGRSTVLSALAGFFFNTKTVISEFMTRKDIANEESSGNAKTRKNFNAGKDGGRLYSGPIVILTTGYSASSSEIFASGMQDTGRAKILGTQTCGCVVGISHQEKMKGGGVLEVSEILWFTPKGRKLEGDGVTPDKIIAPTIADLQQKRDPVLDAAIQLLKTMPAGN